MLQTYLTKIRRILPKKEMQLKQLLIGSKENGIS